MDGVALSRGPARPVPLRGQGIGQNHYAGDTIVSMFDMSRVSVREAADRLGVGTVAVRHHVASGALPAIKRGGSWWLDERALERMTRQRPGGGRSLSPKMAWAVLLLASGDGIAAQEAAGRTRYWLRVRDWVRDHPLEDHAPRLRRRAQLEDFDLHPSELARILERPDVLATGISAGDAIGLIGRARVVEVYAPAGRRSAVVEQHALMAGEGQLRVRWVADELWPLLDRDGDRRAPRAAVLLDLLERDEPRARREAARALRS
jgi:Helix-turn-helix domain